MVGAGGGTGTTPGTQIAHVGGDTWEMNSNRDGMQFNGPSQWQAGFDGGGNSGGRIHGYEGAGLNTRDFSRLTGRGPTAADVEMAQGGGLAPDHPQMGSLASYYAASRGPSQWQRLQGLTAAPSAAPKSDPFSGTPWSGPDVDKTGTMFAADGGDVPAGHPVVVGERGPEMAVPRIGNVRMHMMSNGEPWYRDADPRIVGANGPEMITPSRDTTIVPNEYLPAHHLLNGNIMEYLKRFIR